MIECPECKTEFQDGTVICSECGADLPTVHGPALAPEPALVAYHTPTPYPSGLAPQPVVAEPSAMSHESPGAMVPPLPAQPGPARAKLVVTRGTKVGQEYPLLNDGDNELGRWDEYAGFQPHVDLTEQDQEGYVSRRHAHIRYQGGYWVVTDDPDSVNGVRFRNQQDKLQKNVPYPVLPGDELVLGRVILRFVSEED